MKLLLQADDYGMTRAVAKGILYGIENGIIRNTGIFTNMPWSPACADWIKPFLHKIALGIDLNISTGLPVLPPSELKSLVRDDGSFKSSRESRELDLKCGGEHTDPDELYREFRAQIRRFTELFGCMPDYIHAHAYTTEQILDVQRQLSSEYGIPYTSDVWEKLAGFNVMEYRSPWYKKPPTLENQAQSSLKKYLLENSEKLLLQDYCVIAGHMGYVDGELMELSSYTLYRVNDLEAVTSPEILKWISDNRIELITYKTIKRNPENR